MLNDLHTVLIQHLLRYPKMQPCDAVKLVFQNEFGGGHLIGNKEQSLEYLKKEYAAVQKIKDAALIEDIGNHMFRLNLKAVNVNELPLEKIIDIFVLSANASIGCIENFIEKLQTLREAVSGNIFEFSFAEFDFYLNEYKKSGYPVVSHSSIYREEYHPAYRVVSGKFLNYLQLFYSMKGQE